MPNKPVTAAVPATAEQAQKMMAIRTVYEANPSPELKAAMDVADSDNSALDALYEKVVGAINHITLILVLLLAPALFAQTAHVIVLTPTEAKSSADLYAQRAALDAKINALKDVLKIKYMDPICAADKNAGYWCDSQWALGFEFSTDFKAVVPATQPWFITTSPSSLPSCQNLVNGTLTGGKP